MAGTDELAERVNDPRPNEGEVVVDPVLCPCHQHRHVAGSFPIDGALTNALLAAAECVVPQGLAALHQMQPQAAVIVPE